MPIFAELAKRAVDEAFPDTYILVEVAFVVVALRPVKFWKVDDARARRLFSVTCPKVAPFERILVEDAWVEIYKYVEDAWVAEILPKVARFARKLVVDAWPEM